MPTNDDDALERTIKRALGPDSSITAPPGFVPTVRARLFYAELIERRRRVMRAAVLLAGGSASLFAIVLGLFVSAVDVPAWAVENLPGILGRLDGLRVALARSPGLVAAAAGAVLLMGAGVVSGALRPRRD
jgi:hypothetical protein